MYKEQLSEKYLQQNTLFHTLKNTNGMVVEIMNYGATITKILIPNNKDSVTDVVLGYDSVLAYAQGSSCFGATVGRNANRLRGASFTLNNTEYTLCDNDGGNNLHSGLDYYHKRFWTIIAANEQQITLTLHSPNGDQGYPGSLDITLTYTLTNENELRIEYSAIPDQDTIINLTNHSYFNLDGHHSGTVLSQSLWLDSDAYTKTDSSSIPTGEFINLANTPMDFTNPKEVGTDIFTDIETLRLEKGYNHNWILNNHGNFHKIGSLTSDTTGIVMEIFTDCPGVQVYTANYVNQERGKENALYNIHSGICFETQQFPDAIHHPHFPSPIVKYGEHYNTCTSYKFSTIPSEK